MDNDLYITQLPGATKEEELGTFLEKKLNSNCKVSVRNGKIQGTCIAFCSVGGRNIDEAIQILQFSEFNGCTIKVQKYRVTDRNRKYQNENSLSFQNRESKKPINEEKLKTSPSASNGFGTGIISHTGVLVHVVSAEEFYVQVQSDCSNLQLVTSHLLLCDLGNVGKGVENPIVGEMYAARYSLDGKHYRAVILAEPNDGKIDVRFVDFGNRETVNPNDLKTIDRDIVEVNYVAKRCRFHGLKILDLQGATEMLQAAGEQFTIQRYSEVEAEDKFKLWEIDMIDVNDQSLREKMVEKGLLELLPKTQVANNIKNHVPEVDASGDGIKSTPPEMNGETNSPSNTCLITHVESASNFCIQGVYGKENLQLIHESLMNADNFANVNPANATPHQIYAAKFSLDAKWYRCTIKPGSHGGHIATFIDFGNSEMLSSKLKKLPADIAVMKFQAIKCQLHNVKIINPEMVQVELTRIGNSETALKCQIHRSAEDAIAFVDFGIENRFRSFCSWLIEQRAAERLYISSPQGQSPLRPSANTKMIPPQVMKRYNVRTNQTSPKQMKQNHPMKKRESTSNRQSFKKDAPSRTSLLNQQDNYNGERSGAVVEVFDEGIIREKVLSELTELIESTFDSRMKIIRWRNILGVHQSNGEVSESLFQRLDKLKDLNSETEDENDNSASAVHKKLIDFRQKVMENKDAFYEILSELDNKLAESDVDEAEVMKIADQRDQLAEILVQNVEKFITALSSNTEAVQRRISEIKDTAYDIDFLLNMCPRVEESEVDDEQEKEARDLWSTFTASDDLKRLVDATNHSSSRMDTCRQAFGFITGALGIQAAKQGSHSVKTFFPILDNLNTSMNKELETYRYQFIMGDNGKLTAGCLSRCNKNINGIVQELNNLETEKYSMTEYNHKASEILSARTAMTEETIDSIESSTQQMKKARSQLRHLSADLEDLMENESEDSEELQRLKSEINQVRCNLHSVLKDVMKHKALITHALSMRPELSLHLAKLLRGAGPSMCDSETIANWETSYFDMKPLNPEKTLFSSKFGDEDVIIKKILVSDDGRKLRSQIKSYQDAVSATDSALLPIIAAFAPPKETHVLYVMCPSYDSVESPSECSDYLRDVLTYLAGLRSLRKAGLDCICNSPISYLAKVDGRNQPLLKPSAFFEASSGTIDSDLLIRQLKQVAATSKVERLLLEEIFHDANLVEDIDVIINRISNLLKDETLREDALKETSEVLIDSS